MAEMWITEPELARNLAAVLAKVREGVQVVIEEDHRPIAVIKAPETHRSISALIESAELNDTVLDADFASDLADIVRHRRPWTPRS